MQHKVSQNSFNRVGNAPRVDGQDRVLGRLTREALPTRLNDETRPGPLWPTALTQTSFSSFPSVPRFAFLTPAP